MEIKNMPKETRDFYEENTREQAANKDWNNCKKGRISATLIHDIDRWRKAKQMEKVWDICYKYKPESKAKALEHGIRNEPVAKREIESFFGVVIKQVGCVISGKFPFFCASPDGFVIIDGLRYLIEIKCPFNLSDRSFDEWDGK